MPPRIERGFREFIFWIPVFFLKFLRDDRLDILLRRIDCSLLVGSDSVSVSAAKYNKGSI